MAPYRSSRDLIKVKYSLQGLEYCEKMYWCKCSKKLWIFQQSFLVQLAGFYTLNSLNHLDFAQIWNKILILSCNTWSSIFCNEVCFALLESYRASSTANFNFGSVSLLIEKSLTRIGLM